MLRPEFGFSLRVNLSKKRGVLKTKCNQSFAHRLICFSSENSKADKSLSASNKNGNKSAGKNLSAKKNGFEKQNVVDMNIVDAGIVEFTGSLASAFDGLTLSQQRFIAKKMSQTDINQNVVLRTELFFELVDYYQRLNEKKKQEIDRKMFPWFKAWLFWFTVVVTTLGPVVAGLRLPDLFGQSAKSTAWTPPVVAQPAAYDATFTEPLTQDETSPEPDANMFRSGQKLSPTMRETLRQHQINEKAKAFKKRHESFVSRSASPSQRQVQRQTLEIKRKSRSAPPRAQAVAEGVSSHCSSSQETSGRQSASSLHTGQREFSRGVRFSSSKGSEQHDAQHASTGSNVASTSRGRHVGSSASRNSYEVPSFGPDQNYERINFPNWLWVKSPADGNVQYFRLRLVSSKNVSDQPRFLSQEEQASLLNSEGGYVAGGFKSGKSIIFKVNPDALTIADGPYAEPPGMSPVNLWPQTLTGKPTNDVNKDAYPTIESRAPRLETLGKQCAMEIKNIDVVRLLDAFKPELCYKHLGTWCFLLSHGEIVSTQHYASMHRFYGRWEAANDFQEAQQLRSENECVNACFKQACLRRSIPTQAFSDFPKSSQSAWYKSMPMVSKICKTMLNDALALPRNERFETCGKAVARFMHCHTLGVNGVENPNFGSALNRVAYATRTQAGQFTLKGVFEPMCSFAFKDGNFVNGNPRAKDILANVLEAHPHVKHGVQFAEQIRNLK